ncbi:MAG: peptidase inhibitor family I36 protein [Vicinamibacterales bacterium]
MTRRNTIICLAGLFCMFLAPVASAQPRWGRDRMPQAGACFFEDTNFKGKYFCVRPGERLQSLPGGLGDRISSVRLIGASQVTVFKDADMRGRSARFIGDVRNLKGEGWNDQISSVEVAGAGNQGRWRGDRSPAWGRTEQMPREGACFYEDANFRGQYFCAPRGATFTALPRGFNDRISSVRVFGTEVRLFQSPRFQGRSTEVRSDTPDLRGNWKDNVSSIRVF